MEASVKLGRIFNIPVGVHISWFLIFALVTWSLSSGYFPQEYPGLGGAAYLSLAAITSLLFFASVLIHELAHSVVAIREGIPVKSINLFIFGGVAQITREPKTAGAEFRITIAGPLSSLALAILFFALYQLDQAIPYLAAPSLYLARINLILALFNMIPGFPLDGGRVLRAAIWKLTGNFQRATQIAATAGQLVAFGFMGLGGISLFSGDFFNGLWLIFIGWFLQNAAASNYAQSNLEHRLTGVTVDQAMVRDCECVSGQMRLDDLVNQQILTGGKRCFFVTDNGHLRGLLTLRDVTRIARDRWNAVTTGQSMVPLDKLVTVTPKTPLLMALQTMTEANIAQVPVLEGDTIVGLLSREQVLNYIRLRTELGV
jgi:Zn-dependent protease